MPEAADADQLAKALASFVRAEFEAPVHVVSGFCDLLIEDAGRDGLEGYLEDIEKMKVASDKLEELVAKLLDESRDDASLASGEVEAVTSALRHELRTPITALLGYGELLSEEARDDGHHGLISTLDGLLDASRRLLVQIDAMVDLLQVQNMSADDAPLAASGLPQAVETIRSVLFDEPQPQPLLKGRILVVDDNVSNLDLVSRRLTRDGHEVVDIAELGEAGYLGG